MVGVAKAFSTRVGGGPFVTELFDDMAMRLRGTGSNPWTNMAAPPGRPRRVGWLDSVALRYAVQLNGITELALTKLDILSGLPELKIATAYNVNGECSTDFPQDSEVLARCQPVYETLPGWTENVSGVRAYADLPKPAQAYVERIEALAGARVSLVSVGPEREQLIAR